MQDNYLTLKLPYGVTYHSMFGTKSLKNIKEK